MTKPKPEHSIGRAVALNAIANERNRQDAQWGGAEHDDEHEPHDWLWFMRHQIDAAFGERDLSADVRARAIRGRLIKIAALALAAIESTDRLAVAERVRVHDAAAKAGP